MLQIKVCGLAVIGSLFITGMVLADAEANRKVKPAISIKPDEDDRDTETAVNLDEGVFLGFGGLSLGMSTIDGKSAGSFGFQGAWVIAEKYVVGIDYFQATLSNNDRYTVDGAEAGDRKPEFRYNQVGLLLQRIVDTHKIFHPTYSLLIARGAGYFDGVPDNEFGNDVYENYRKTKNVSILEPRAGYEMNVTKYFRAGLEAGLRLPVSGDEKDFPIDTGDFLGFNLMLTLKFGNFRY